MNSMAFATQQKFSNLRRRLDQLGYHQPLGVESLPLIERLFLDLVHTTDSLKKAKLKYGNPAATSTTGTIAQVDAYKSDNAKLIKENNELHQKLIHRKEESEFAIKKLKASLRKIEHEHADLKFLNNQYVHKIHSLEEESKQKTERILQLQEKNFNAIIQTPGGRKKDIPFRRQRMEVDCAVPPSDAAGSAALLAPITDPYVADLLKVADDSIAHLRKELSILRDDKTGLEIKISNVKKQVDLRDTEIDRLTRMFEGGRPNDIIALEAHSRQNEKTVSHLNIQLDYLQEKNRELQDQLDRQTSGAKSSGDLSARKHELTQELQDIGLMTQELHLEKDRAIHFANLEIDPTKENEQHLEELENIKQELNNERQENEKLSDLIQKLHEDKRHLEQKVNKLTTNEQDLVLKIDRLNHQHEYGVMHRQQSSTSRAVDTLIKGMEEERDYWMNEGLTDANELTEMRRERDELQTTLDKFERHVSEIQANVQVLTLERDSLNLMLEETKKELTRAYHEAVGSPKSAKASLAAQAVLRRVENERDEAVLSCCNLSVECDSLKERLQMANESNLVEHAKLKQTIENMDIALNMAESNLKTVEERLRLSQAHLEACEARLKESMAETATTRNETSQYRATTSQMRVLAEQAERSLRDIKTQLTQKDADLRSTDDRILAFTDQLNALKRVSQSDKDEIVRLRAAIAQLDQEKDELQIAVDDKTEQEVKKAEAMAAKEWMVCDLRYTVAEMEAIVSRLKDDVASKEHEVVSLRKQLDSISEELTEAGHRHEVALRENRRIQEDLATMTCENQCLNQELEEALQEKEHLREQAQEYVVEIKRCEELLAAKEQERTDILEQYRSLSHETEHIETQVHHLESEGSNLKLEILTKDSEVHLMRDKLEQAERDMHEHIAAEHAYEVRLSNMAKSIATLEEAMNCLEEEKHSLLFDLSAFRELFARLEITKENQQRLLMAKSLDHEKLQTLLDDVKHESETLRSQVSNERSTKQNLESLLQENRTREWQAQVTIKEKDAQIQLLKNEIQTTSSKIEYQSRELNQYRTRTIEIESDLERLKRQLISERFEREKVVQELRRNGLSVPGESGVLGAINPSRCSAKSPMTHLPLEAELPTE